MERRGFVYKRTETGRRYLGVELKTTLWGPE
jgi:hypothetical protein